MDRLPGVSSGGQSLPFLFGLGSPLAASDPDVYDPRRDGITVRATAIADARPVLSAGLPRDGLEGLLPVGANPLGGVRVLAFNDDWWRLQGVGIAFTVRVRPNAAVTDGAADPAAPAGLALPVVTSRLSVGDVVLQELVQTLGAVLVAVDVLPVHYVPIYSVRGVFVAVTGFAAVRIDVALPELDADGNLSLLLSGVKLASRVANGNASAHPLLAANADLLLDGDPARELLTAPALVR